MIEQKINGDTFLVTDLRPSEYVIVHSDGFGDCHGYVQDLFVPHDAYRRTPLVTVRLDLPDDHPAIQDGLADNPERDADWLEFIDIVPGSQLERISGERIHFGERAITPRERSARARQRGFSRVAFPELDAGLRR